MTVVDSSGWIEVFADGPSAGRFRGHIERAEVLVVPTVVIYEVWKVTRRERSETAALVAVAELREHVVVPLDDELALMAADLSLKHGLAMADAIVYATAQTYEALLVTGDKHFAGLPGVEYIALEGD